MDKTTILKSLRGERGDDLVHGRQGTFLIERTEGADKGGARHRQAEKKNKTAPAGTRKVRELRQLRMVKAVWNRGKSLMKKGEGTETKEPLLTNLAYRAKSLAC